MTESNDNDDNKPTNDPNACTCPVNETWRHVLYIGGMIALHAGLGATAMVSEKTHKCPVSEWVRHAVYTGAAVALIAMLPHHTTKAAIEAAEEDTTNEEAAAPKKWYQVCPLNEWAKHAVYVAGMVGIVAWVNARKK